MPPGQPSTVVRNLPNALALQCSSSYYVDPNHKISFVATIMNVNI